MAALGQPRYASQRRQNGGLRSITFPGTRHAHEVAFDYEGLVRTAYILCAFGFAVLAGLLMRRSIPANRAFIPWLAVGSWSSSCSGRTS